MWKFKKELFIASIMILLVLFYVLFAYEGLRGTTALDIHMFKDYPFMFVLNSAVFTLFFNEYCFELSFNKFETITRLMSIRIVDFGKSIAMFFAYLTIGQIIIYSVFDPLFSIYFLVYRNFILLCIAFLFYLISLAGKRRNLVKRIIFLYAIWNLLYIGFLFMPESFLNILGLFDALLRVDVFLVMKLMLLGVTVGCITYVRIKNYGREMVEL